MENGFYCYGTRKIKELIMIKNSISIEQTISQVKGNIVSDMGGEKVMLSIENGKYYNLGEMGGEIWELIQDKITTNEIIATLLSRYDVEKSVCEEQVVTFLEHLYEEKLIEVVE